MAGGGRGRGGKGEGRVKERSRERERGGEGGSKENGEGRGRPERRAAGEEGEGERGEEAVANDVRLAVAATQSRATHFPEHLDPPSGAIINAVGVSAQHPATLSLIFFSSSCTFFQCISPPFYLLSFSCPNVL